MYLRVVETTEVEEGGEVYDCSTTSFQWTKTAFAISRTFETSIQDPHPTTVSLFASALDDVSHFFPVFFLDLLKHYDILLPPIIAGRYEALESGAQGEGEVVIRILRRRGRVCVGCLWCGWRFRGSGCRKRVSEVVCGCGLARRFGGIRVVCVGGLRRRRRVGVVMGGIRGFWVMRGVALVVRGSSRCERGVG